MSHVPHLLDEGRKRHICVQDQNRLDIAFYDSQQSTWHRKRLAYCLRIAIVPATITEC